MIAITDPIDHVIINKLPSYFDEANLVEMASAFGGTTKWCRLTQDKFSDGKCAIVELSSIQEASNVVQNLNGQILDGCTEPIEVGFKWQKNAGKNGGKGGNGK